ncbi:uncharacterized protein LOC131292823 [Anopheles ziemanni]|uniref:uncharacterized protein LOC131271172 n=1 Tax=Anopheles coustani TaxID=139045 RepID=UPI00265A7D8F|nr:uncharacterized protein LOC131271172 [Anopheles coustani]XP_058176889.1 uncharacterized protein LOC131292823 [Anopheles ziemanni]
MAMESTAIEDMCGWCFAMLHERVAQCDGCKKWFHFECVELTEATVTEEWQCKKCEGGSAGISKEELTSGEITREINSLRRQLRERQEKEHASDCELLEGQRRERARGQEQLEVGLSRVTAAQRGRTLTYASKLASSSTMPSYWRNEASANEPELSKSQLAARNVVSGKLPTFSGNPDEWCSFKSRFDTSTRMCGFTDDENVMRLQECLTGRALRAVQCRLHQPRNLIEVMDTLEKLFGRPEVLINNILQQIRETPPPKMERLQTIVDYGVAVEELCATVRNSGLHEQLVNAALLQELVDRLPPHLRLDWGLHRRAMPSTVSLESFGTWMNAITDAAILVTPPVQEAPKRAEVRRVYSHHEGTEDNDRPRCLVCNKDDCPAGPDCAKFLAATVDERWNCLRRWRLCRTCLWKHNGRCHVTRPCGEAGCSAYHHKLLHNPTRPDRQTQSNVVSSLSHVVAGSKTLLKYVPVTVYGAGKSINTYALLDDGSAVTLMDQDLLAELGVEGYPNPICLSWTGELTREEPASRTVSLEISAADNAEKTYVMRNAHTVADLALRQQTLAVEELTAAYDYLGAADVKGYTKATPRILIGIDNLHLMTTLKTIEGSPGQPIAAKTRLGWVICGTQGTPTSRQPHSVYMCTCTEADSRLDDTLRKYFLTDHISYDSPVTILSRSDERALTILESTTRLIDERYETSLLWKSDDISLPDNRKMALKRLECLERRMKREPDLANAVNEKLTEHLSKGYVRKLLPEELTSCYARKWYLPIFPITNPNKPGKMRLVWDAAATHQGTSLNANLISGPDLLTELPAVLHKFREFKFAITADIREMYHQVKINEKDMQSQRFLWRWGNADNKPEEFVMTRMTFGATCSPASALFVKNLNAERFATDYPRAVQCIKEQHYVDDMLASTELEEEALKLAQEVELIHGKGGFALHNWRSNSTLVNIHFGCDVGYLKEINFDSSVSVEKILGMWWNWHTDTFHFKLTPKRDHELLDGQQTPTKRQVLRMLMSIYDPLGLIAGYLWFLKVILQEVWRTRAGWDVPINEDLDNWWKEWLSGLRYTEKISIPRCYRQYVTIDGLKVQLHVFVDAGKDGYAAVAYLRFENNGTTEVSLVGGKAKVAPLKYVSVPRMELQAAVVGARLASHIQRSHTQPISECILWTDSRDVMCWLDSDHRRYSIFVAHRVSEILEKSTIDDWRWVPTRHNVADECTKWGNLQRHLTNSRWFTGPEFLGKPATEWPPLQATPTETEEEARIYIGTHHIAPAPLIMFERFPRWRTLLRAMGYVSRFIMNCRSKQSGNTGPLVQEELQKAERIILREVQRQVYPAEYNMLLKPPGLSTTIRLPKTKVAYSLSTDACILAIRNFIVRKGTPIEIFSDQGTNFVGANRELIEAMKKVDKERLMEELDIPNMKWSFNPPSAPHFGGAWERMIQTVKKTLEGMPFHHLPTDPILKGMLVEAEGIINARPLTHVPVDRQEEAPLTPNHFLLGSSSGTKPLLPLDDSPIALKNNWKATQIYADVLWKRWVKSYLPTLTRRTKWFEPVEPMKVGDAVLIVDESLPRNCWPRGIVEKLTISRDGVVRKAVVLTAKGTRLERPAVKLAKIQIEREESTLEATHGGECQ